MSSIKETENNISSLQNTSRSSLLIKENKMNKKKSSNISSSIIQDKINKMILNNNSLESTVKKKSSNAIEVLNDSNQDLIEKIKNQRKLILENPGFKYENGLKQNYENQPYFMPLKNKNSLSLEDTQALHMYFFYLE